MILPNVTLSMRFHHTRFDVNELKVTLDDVFSKHDEVHGQMTEEEQSCQQTGFKQVTNGCNITQAFV